MAVDKLVDSTQLNTDLTAVADAIRTKGGTSASLAFPTGFVDAIEAIETGGGGDIDSYINGTAESIVSDVTVVRDRAFQDFTALKTVELTGNVWIKGNGFSGCTGITSFKAYNAYRIYGNAFYDVACDALVFPNITSEIGSSAFTSFKGTKVDLGGAALAIKTAVFSGATNLTTIILRKPSVVSLTATSCFSNSPFASGKAGGTLYVPSSLISSYQSATNWSTILGYANNSIQAIEGSIYETQYADGTPIT